MKKIILISLISLLSFQIVFGQRKPTKEKPLIVSCGVCNQKAIYLPKPEYPKVATTIRASGKVEVQILIDEEGNVVEAKAVSGHPLLHTSSIKAAFQAKFEPFLLSGKSVRVNGTIIYNFSLDSSGETSKENEYIETIPLGLLNDKALKISFFRNQAENSRLNETIKAQVTVNLQKGTVLLAKAISVYGSIKNLVEMSALQTTFKPILNEFPTIYGTGILTFQTKHFTGKTVENKKPKPIITIIKGGILNGKAIVLPKPVYSEKMQNSCVYGKVEVEVLNYAPTGRILFAKAILGDEILRKSAEDAARKTTFSVPLINGDKNFYVKGKLIYNFEPSEKCISGQLSDVKKFKLVSDLRPKVISMPKPEFPYGGINVGGNVSVIVTIDEQGNVINAGAISGHPLLRPSAEKAAMKAKFEPVTLSGKPIKISFPIAYVFNREEIPQLEILKDKEIARPATKIQPCGILTGKAIKLFKPNFPKNCRCKFSNNYKTVVQFTVNENGFVESAIGVSGHPLLRAVSVQTVRRSKFSPSFNCNKAVKAYGTIIYDFAWRKNSWQSRVIKYELKLEK